MTAKKNFDWESKKTGLPGRHQGQERRGLKGGLTCTPGENR